MEFNEQPYTNLGSRRMPGGPTLSGPPRVRWLRPSEKTGATAGLMLGAAGLLLGTCDEVPSGDYYDLDDYRVELLDLETGKARWKLENRRPLGVVGEVALVVDPGFRRQPLEAYRLSDGALAWSLDLEGEWPWLTRVTEHGLYYWKSALRYLNWESRRVEAIPLPAGEIGWVREGGGTLAVHTWRAQPRVHGETTVFQRGQAVWKTTEDGDVFCDEQGWLLRSREALHSYDPTGALRWTATGSRRCWVSPGWVAQERGSRLYAVDRSSGAEHEVAPFEPWNLAITGDHLWLAARLPRGLSVVSAQGRKLWQGPQPDVGGYGLDELWPWAGRLYGVGDHGTVVCLEGC